MGEEDDEGRIRRLGHTDEVGHVRKRQREGAGGGLLDDERLHNLAELRGFEVFPKPYSAAELYQEVKDVLNKPRGGTAGTSKTD